jgi:hypothetical protein
VASNDWHGIAAQEMDEKKPAKRRAYYPYDLVEVQWLDASTDSGWLSEDEQEPTVPLVVTVGFLVKQNEALLSIASTVGDARDHNSRIQIPIGMVVEMRVIKKQHRKK